MANRPLVSLLLVVRNEADHVCDCIRSLLCQTYPTERLQIVVVDGMSTDGTRARLELLVPELRSQGVDILLKDNPNRTLASGWNIGIANSKGDYICRLDVHSRLCPDYVEKCVGVLEREGNVAAVGGVCKTMPGSSTPQAAAIAVALSHPFGVGNSYFRIGTRVPRRVDTVAYGCYRKCVLDEAGPFCEGLRRNQDLEMHKRIKSLGYSFLLLPSITSTYFARSTFRSLFAQYFSNGFWITFGRRYGPTGFSARHLIPSVFVLTVLSSLLTYMFTGKAVFLSLVGLYALSLTLFSTLVSRHRTIRLAPMVAVAFMILHFSSGLGALWGQLLYWIAPRTRSNSTITCRV